MKTKTALTALALATVSALAPAVALAECSSKHVQISCADGKVWDEKTASCITPTG